MRTCTKCPFTGELKDFYSFKRGDKTYYRGVCRTCYSKKSKEIGKSFHKKNPPYCRNANLKRHFGITLETYESILKSQNYTCKICPATHSGSKKSPYLFVDHCHKTGKIRGLLCHKCNMLLGFSRDNPLFLEQAINYLQKHK